MAYERRILFQTPLLSWQQLTLQAAQATWSDEYRVDGPRLFLPLTSCLECRVGSSVFICDPGAALWLTPTDPYRMRRPWAAQKSLLIAIEADLGPPCRPALSLATHIRMRRWFRALASRRVEPLELEEHLTGVFQI